MSPGVLGEVGGIEVGGGNLNKEHNKQSRELLFFPHGDTV